MTKKSKEKRRARVIQELTGWSYMECLRVADLDDAALDALIKIRKETASSK